VPPPPPLCLTRSCVSKRPNEFIAERLFIFCSSPHFSDFYFFVIFTPLCIWAARGRNVSARAEKSGASEIPFFIAAAAAPIAFFHYSSVCRRILFFSIYNRVEPALFSPALCLLRAFQSPKTSQQTHLLSFSFFLPAYKYYFMHFSL
jgi:hypothetical protein